MTTELFLGRKIDYPRRYSPELLCPIPRADSRAALGLAGDLPFHGCDIWNAWELGWLDGHSQPQVAIAEIRVPAESPNIIESKSFKLYLNSLAMTRFETPTRLVETLITDTSHAAGADVRVALSGVADSQAASTRSLEGECLDSRSVRCDTWNIDSDLLAADPDSVVSEVLHSHLLRSLCPVTNQPDCGSVQISYRGPRIDHDSLLRYVVSFREHNDFHESCIERMFLDILDRCSPDRLTVYARYLRRGGIDINPFRSNFESEPENVRLWRQ